MVVLLTVFSFFFKKSGIISTLLFVLMWVLFGWNYWNADYGMYNDMYGDSVSEIIFFEYEGGYEFLIFCCKSIGLNFHQFHALIAAIVLLLVFRFFHSFSYLPALLTVCFFWIFFPLQFVLFRNFIAFSIMLQGLISVLRNEKYSNEKYVFFVLLASTIHISSLFYLVFLFAFGKTEVKIKTISLWAIVLLIVLFINHDFIFSTLTLVHEKKALFYRTSLPLFLAYSFTQILNLYVVNYFLKLDSNSGDDENSRANIVVLNINILMLFLIPVYYEMAVFVRILLNFSIVNIVFITNKSFMVDHTIFPKILLLLYLLFWFFGFIFFVRETTIIPLFFNNLLFS
ncbi:EpsG family protein [Flavobacterium galactosidilyticum]|uniref:EpsG family protein n=1 Tax=Flavobacterium galactosidilyticum TaxID=2893886 RepID=UPI001E4E65E0|nr:EpsG family protein [Flavobacterium sp. F-340]UFH46686.1 EpsG family protein [Flavobacterium sp. F-340]